MKKVNRVFIATSLDGYIADRNGELDWLHAIPNSENNDMGYARFMDETDALVMGRNTFETVCGFDIAWPYQKPVFVLSNTLDEIPPEFKDKAELVKGELHNVLEYIHKSGHHSLYIDGGKTIQAFLREDLIDEIVITTIPVLLGGGVPLFGELTHTLEFECTGTHLFLDKIVQNCYRRVR